MAPVSFGHPPDEGWQPIADALRQRPGEWARITRPGIALRAHIPHIKTGRIKAFRPPGAFTARMIRGELWAVYLGDHTTPEQARTAALAAADRDIDARLGAALQGKKR